MAFESEWWKNNHAEDIYANLRLKEQTIPFYHAQSSQLWIRRHLVQWLSVVVNALGICATAQHLAVYLLDTFMDGLEVHICYIHLVALVCLLIAVKSEDIRDRIPHFSTLNSYIPMNQYNGGQPYTARQFLHMEMNILKYMSFKLCVPTVAHFLPYYLQMAVAEDDLMNGMPIVSKVNVEMNLEKRALYFQEIVLQDNWCRDYPPSLVAAACVVSAKVYLKLTPAWPKQLELLTKYCLEQLLPCLQKLLGAPNLTPIPAVPNLKRTPLLPNLTPTPAVPSLTPTPAVPNLTHPPALPNLTHASSLCVAVSTPRYGSYCAGGLVKLS